MIRIVILDDEAHCRDTLKIHLENLSFPVEIVALYSTPTEFLENIGNHKFDILCLDIEMPKMNGFELLDQISSYQFSVIFTTAYSQYAIQAFKYTAFDYLLKPIAKSDLEECLQRWKDNFMLSTSSTQIEYLKEILENEKAIDKITLSTKDGYVFIRINEIIYCESQSNYTIFYLKDDRRIVASRTLKKFESLLIKHLFLRIHKSYLINIKSIYKLQKGHDSSIELQNGEILPISRARVSEVKKFLDIE
jgi:two-component system LytT family response regulator